MRCPRCNKLEYGQVGNGQYYCWNCCLEFHGEPGRWRVYALEEDGSLVDWAEGLGSAQGAPAAEVPAGLGGRSGGG